MTTVPITLMVIISVIVAKSGYVGSERISKDELERRVDEYINAGLACHNNPALSLSVVSEDEVRSNIVAFIVAFVVLMLPERFQESITANFSLSLATTVKSVLGDDVFYGYLRSRYTTLEDLLAHRMGVPSNNNIRLDDTVNRRTLMKRLKYLRPIGGFRTSFYYSNLMYGLVTYIAEVIGKDTWENLVQSELYGPLDMTSSTFTTTADPGRIDLAQGYQDNGGTLYEVPFEFNKRWGELCGSGCVVSNGVDMAKWMMFHMNGGRNQHNVKIVDSNALDDAHKAQNSISVSSIAKYYTRPVAPVTLSHGNYGLGWRLGHYRGYPIVTHSGSTYGYRALVTMIPSLKVGIFTALTGDDPGFLFRTNIHLFIADLLLGESPWLNSTTVCTFPEPWKRKKQTNGFVSPRRDIPPPRNLTSYTGGYSNDAYGNIKVYVNNTSHVLMAQYGFASFNLYPKTNKDDFYAEGTGILKNIRDFSTWRFVPDKTNMKIISLGIPSFETKNPPTFRRSKRAVKATSVSETDGCVSRLTDRHVYVLVVTVLILSYAGI